MKIALVDDSRKMREDFMKAFEKKKEYELKVYEFGDEFLKDVLNRKEEFDILFLDGTLMNGISSYDVLEKIKEIEIKVIMFGGFQFEDVEDWMKRGVQGFVSKPIDEEQIINILKRK